MRIGNDRFGLCGARFYAFNLCSAARVREMDSVFFLMSTFFKKTSSYLQNLPPLFGRSRACEGRFEASSAQASGPRLYPSGPTTKTKLLYCVQIGLLCAYARAKPSAFCIMHERVAVLVPFANQSLFCTRPLVSRLMANRPLAGPETLTNAFGIFQLGSCQSLPPFHPPRGPTLVVKASPC